MVNEKMINSQLTDTMIRQSFDNTGVDKMYFPVYEAEIKRCFYELQKDCPDDKDTIDEDSNAYCSIDLANDFIKYYVEEAEKGHCPNWCKSVAKYSVAGVSDYWIYREAYDGLGSDEEKERELDIHTNSLNEDPVFRARYKMMFKDCINTSNLIKITEEYTRIYHLLISKGKSEVYACAYADMSDEYQPFYCEIYAEAYELASDHGMGSSEAYCFGDFCTEAVDQGLWTSVHKFNELYHEQWQKEFYLKLICDEIKQEEKREIDDSLLSVLKKELGL